LRLGGQDNAVSASDNQNGFFSRLENLNPFKDGGSRYIRLPLTNQDATVPAENDTWEEPSWFQLSRWDRLLIFGMCLAGSAACFALCFFIMPVLALKPRKFGLLWSLGSLLFVISFGVLQGPVNYVVHLVSPTRLPFTLAYFGSIIATLIFSVGMRSTILTILATVVQIIAAIWYTVSYFPMGAQSLKFASRVGARQVTAWMNS
jgi:hypothetical protein